MNKEQHWRLFFVEKCFRFNPNWLWQEFTCVTLPQHADVLQLALKVWLVSFFFNWAFQRNKSNTFKNRYVWCAIVAFYFSLDYWVWSYVSSDRHIFLTIASSCRRQRESIKMGDIFTSNTELLSHVTLIRTWVAFRTCHRPFHDFFTRSVVFSRELTTKRFLD